jgi:hypothetical protein
MARIRKGRFASLSAGFLAAGFFGMTWARYRRDIPEAKAAASNELAEGGGSVML